MVLPKAGNDDPSAHAWADARFTAEILAEHALFFALLMREELAAQERAAALRFMQTFTALHERIDAGPPPPRSELK